MIDIQVHFDEVEKEVVPVFSGCSDAVKSLIMHHYGVRSWIDGNMHKPVIPGTTCARFQYCLVRAAGVLIESDWAEQRGGQWVMINEEL